MGVVDSGIEADHPSLGGCVDEAQGLTVTLDEAGQAVDMPGPHDDSFGHGTAVAGIIHSIAPEASVTSVKVLGPGLSGKAAAFLRGLGWAVEQGFDVINLSLGTTKRDWALPFYEICDQAYFRGSLLVTAANNVMRPSFPSLYASVTSVACNLATDPFRFQYNPEPPTEFLARGIDVELLRRAAHLRDRRPRPLQAPRAAAVPGQDRAVGGSGQRARGTATGGAPQPVHAHADRLHPGQRRPAGAGAPRPAARPLAGAEHVAGHLALADVEEELAQCRPALGTDGRQDLVLHLLEDGPQACQPAPSRSREAHHVAPAILGIAVPLDQPLLLELVEHSDQLTAVEPECVGDGSLGVPRALVEEGQDAQVVQVRPGSLEGVTGGGLDGRAQVAEEEHRAVEQLPRPSCQRQPPSTRVFCHHGNSVAVGIVVPYDRR